MIRYEVYGESFIDPDEAREFVRRETLSSLTPEDFFNPDKVDLEKLMEEIARLDPELFLEIADKIVEEAFDDIVEWEEFDGFEEEW